MKDKQIDYRLFFAVFSLIIFWMVMISSVSVFSSYKITGWDSNNHFLIRNIIHIAISSFLIVIIAKTPYKFFQKYSYIFMGIWILSLMAVLVFWTKLYWAKWWLFIKWLPFWIQPTEFTKVAVILFLSAMFAKYKGRIGHFKKWFMPYIWLIWLIFMLIAMQPDFGSILVIVPVATILFFVAWWNVRHLFLMWSIWLILLISVYFMGKYDPDKILTKEDRPTFAYIYDRVNSFLWNEEDEAKSWNILYQQDQWLIAIWTGWLLWVGFGSSIQKYGYVPQVEWDFIFSVIVEELWFLWALWLIWIYLFIWYRCFVIANNSKDDFSKYFAIWIWSRILMQAFVNLWVNLKLLPNTWITLPFVSYGGSSLMSLAIWIAILLWISRDVDKELDISKRKKWKIFQYSTVNMVSKK